MDSSNFTTFTVKTDNLPIQNDTILTSTSDDVITFGGDKVIGSSGSNTIYPADHPSQAFWYEDGISLTGNPGAYSSDTISFATNQNMNKESNNGFWKYHEDKILKQLE